jgi:hypothetical protein
VLIVLGYHHPHRSDLDAMVAMQVRLGAIPPQGAAELRARALRTMEGVPDRAVWATRSTMLAAATLMIAAESLGVNSAPMEGFDPVKVKEAFGVPDDHTVCCLIALGFAAESQPFPAASAWSTSATWSTSGSPGPWESPQTRGTSPDPRPLSPGGPHRGSALAPRRRGHAPGPGGPRIGAPDPAAVPPADPRRRHE